MTKLEKICIAIILGGSLLILATPLIVYNGLYFPFIFSKGLYFQFLVEILFPIWIILFWKHPQYRPNFRNPLVFLPGLFILITFITSLFGVNFERSFFSYQERMTGILFWIHLYFWLLIITNSLKHKWQWLTLIKFSIFFSIISGIYGIVKTTPQTPVISGTLGNTIYMGCYCVMNIFLAGLLFFQEKRKFWRILALLTIPFNLWVAAETGSRGIIIGLICGILTFLTIEIFYLKNKKHRLLIYLGAFLLVASFVFINTQRNAEWIKNAPYFLQRMSKSAVVDYRRTLAWKAGWDGFLQKPITGWGWENFDAVFDSNFNPWFTRYNPGATWYDKSHNQLVDILCLTGIFGLLTYLLFYYFYLQRTFKTIRNIENSEKRRSREILLAAMIAYFVQNLLVFDTPGILVLFFFYLGLVQYFTLEERGSINIKEIEIQELENKKLSSKELKRLENKLQKKHIMSNDFPPIPVILCLILSTGFFMGKFIVKPYKSSHKFIRIISGRDVQPVETVDRLEVLLAENNYNNTEYVMNMVELLNRRNADGKLTSEKFKKLLSMTIEGMKKNVAENPYSVRYRVYLGYLYAIGSNYNQDYMEKSIENYEKALEICPKRQEIYYHLVTDYISLQNYEEALNQAQKAFEIDKLTVSSKDFYGLTLMLNKKFDEGFPLISDDFYTEKLNLVLLAGKKIFQEENYEAAYTLSQKISKLNPENYQSIMIEAYSAYKINKSAEGIEAMNRFKKINPEKASQFEAELRNEKLIK